MEFDDLDKLLNFIPEDINKLIFDFYNPICEFCRELYLLCQYCNDFYCPDTHNKGFYYCPVCCSCACGYKFHYLTISGVKDEICYKCYTMEYKGWKDIKKDKID